MRTLVLGCLAVAVLAAAASVVFCGSPAAMGQQGASPRAGASEQGLVMLAETVQQQYQQLTVLDPKREVLSVYHVDLASGAISLRSVRNIHWDLQVSDYNGQKPLPREIQALLEQR